MAGGGAAAGGGEAARRPAGPRSVDTAAQQAPAFTNSGDLGVCSTGGERVRASRVAPAPAADNLDMLDEELVQPQIEGDVLEPAGLPTVASLLHPKSRSPPVLTIAPPRPG